MDDPIFEAIKSCSHHLIGRIGRWGPGSPGRVGRGTDHFLFHIYELQGVGRCIMIKDDAVFLYV